MKKQPSATLSLSKLEARAAKGDAAAKRKLEQIHRILNPGKAGRKAGSKTTFTRSGADLFENKQLAYWGADADSLGAQWAHIEWVLRHQSEGTLRLRAEQSKQSVEDLRAADLARSLSDPFQELVAKSIDARDWKFFRDFASALSRINGDGTLKTAEPQRGSLLAYSEFMVWKNPDHKFSMAELLDDVPWGTDENGATLRPAETHLRRLCGELAIPMRRGPAPKPKPST